MLHAVYTNYMIGRLQKNVDIATDNYAMLISAALFDKLGSEGEKMILGNIVENSDIPIIITTPSWKPIIWKNVTSGPFFNRIEIDMDDQRREILTLLDKKVKEMRREYPPKVIYGRDRKTQMGYLVFGSTGLIHGLAWLPFIEGTFIILFSAFVYFALHNIMLTERSNLWVGLAKETAHQLGTPLSSLMGWIEYMRSLKEGEKKVDAEGLLLQIEDICTDMDKDIARLQKVTSRFSQIGSRPALALNNINDILKDSIKYFDNRLPIFGKHIGIVPSFGTLPPVPLNKELIEWVFENLFKNSIDAIERNEGHIEIKTEYIECDDIIRIQHTDNGKGISWDLQKTIFSPGYTTKTRGWGLGLTLAKRIVEDYHHGRIYVSWSHRGKGTTICIDLPVAKESFSESQRSYL
jgi:signal transduction histidine kinase